MNTCRLSHDILFKVSGKREVVKKFGSPSVWASSLIFLDDSNEFFRLLVIDILRREFDSDQKVFGRFS